MRQVIRKVLLGILVLFLLPLAVHAALYAGKDRPASFRDADWSSVGMLRRPDSEREARFLVFTSRTGRWKGIFAVHSWIAFKPENATSWSRYDVVGWGQPVRTNGWAADGRWFGDTPRVLVDGRGSAATTIIPRVKAAIAALMAKVLRVPTEWGGHETTTPHPPLCCEPCRNSRRRCHRTPWARISALILTWGSPIAAQVLKLHCGVFLA